MIYSDKLTLCVVDLTHIQLATEEDKQYQIDYWAAIFKAKTWEELKMIAQKNEFMKEAGETLYQLNEDEMIRLRCLARQDYYRTQYAYQKAVEEANARAEKANAKANDANARVEVVTAEKEVIAAENEALIAELTHLRKLLADREVSAQK